jgi:transcription initiation factor TFIIIB Brf1 subunit/transcription initiation factor TFIIB
VVDGYELVCLDNGEVLEQYYFEDAQTPVLQSPLGSGEKWVEKALRVFNDVVKLATSHFNIPSYIIESARRKFAELARKKKITFSIEHNARRYAVALLWHYMRKENMPVSYREYISVFGKKKRFMKFYRRVVGEAGEKANAASLKSFRAFLLKAVSAAGITLSDDLLRRAEEIAEILKSKRAIKPNILAMVSLIIAGEEKGLKVPKGKVARALGIVNYYGTLKYARSLLSHTPK